MLQIDIHRWFAMVARNGAKTRSPQNFVWGLNNNK
jgi:hypothetical protein